MRSRQLRRHSVRYAAIVENGKNDKEDKKDKKEEEARVRSSSSVLL